MDPVLLSNHNIFVICFLNGLFRFCFTGKKKNNNKKHAFFFFVKKKRSYFLGFYKSIIFVHQAHSSLFSYCLDALECPCFIVTQFSICSHPFYDFGYLVFPIFFYVCYICMHYFYFVIQFF